MARFSAALIWLLALAGGAQAGPWGQSGIASIYNEGRHTASGERFSPMLLTAAHRTLPFGSRVLVRHGVWGVIVRINDRGPWKARRIIDLTPEAARQLHLAGLGSVSIELLH